MMSNISSNLISSMKKTLFIFLGSLSFALGTAGVFIPLLPTVPFYLLTAYFWMHSSKKLHGFLVNSRYYKKYIQKVIIEKKATPRKLVKMMIVLLILLSIPFIFTHSIYVRIILCLVFIGHLIGIYLYFIRKP